MLEVKIKDSYMWDEVHLEHIQIEDVLETLKETEDEYLKLYNEYETLKSLIEGFIWVVVGIVIAFFVIFLIS